MGDLLDGYTLLDVWDEMYEAPGRPRDQYRTVHDLVATMSRGEFTSRAAVRDRSFREQGITFSLAGEERPFPLDLVPRVIPADEWAVVEAGVAQRVRALEAFLADVYTDGAILRDRVVPRSLVTTSPNFVREAAGFSPPNGVRVHVAGIDLVRGADGRFRVLEDNVRIPSGVSYVLENRRVMTQVFPEIFASHRIRPVADYPAQLAAALRAAAPPGRDDPVVAVLTPGLYNSAYFEHSFLAREMGVELVEGRDLVCRGGVVTMRTTEGEVRVDVIYRRVDDDFLDPVHFRADSVLGCPGILNAARQGNVVVANAVGNGVADDKAVYPYVPAIIAYYLGERPLLDNVTTYCLGDPDQRADALDRLDRLVVKPVDGSGGKGIVIGPLAADEELARVRAAVLEDPRRWIAQEVVALSTSPTYVDGCLAPRHVDLRPFAVNDGERVTVVPGGLTRVALREGSLVVNSSQGGGSKDTWVLAEPGRGDQNPRARPAAATIPLPGRPPDPGPAGAGTPAQQQQQQQSGPAPC